MKVNATNHLSEKYANKPNLWRVACELSKSKDMDKAMDITARILRSGVKEPGAA